MTDPFTPFFLPWRARLAAARRALPRTDPRAPGPQQLEALFTPRLPRHWLSPEADGDCSRQRDWPLRRTCWTFLAQVLSPGSACRAAVRQAQTAARLEQRPVPRDDTSAYGQARLRLLVTTLLDGEQFPVSALAALYRQRWQVELSLRQLKTALAMEHLAVR